MKDRNKTLYGIGAISGAIIGGGVAAKSPTLPPTKSKFKNIKENPQSKFETQVRDIFGNIAKGTLKLAEDRMKIPKTKSKDTRYRFYTMYPSWLRWKGKELEIDGYNVWLGLAFEVQGPQHTEFGKMDSDYKAYYNRLCNDAAKRKLASEYGVGLITIDYTVPKHLLSDYIKSRIYDLCNVGRQPTRMRCELLEPISTHMPTNYIAEMKPIPYRNYELEKQMSLNILDANGNLLEGKIGMD